MNCKLQKILILSLIRLPGYNAMKFTYGKSFTWWGLAFFSVCYTVLAYYFTFFFGIPNNPLFLVLFHRFLFHGHCHWGYPRFLNASWGAWKGDLYSEGAKRLTMSLWRWGAWKRFDMCLQGLFLTLFTLLTKTVNIFLHENSS